MPNLDYCIARQRYCDAAEIWRIDAQPWHVLFIRHGCVDKAVIKARKTS